MITIITPCYNTDIRLFECMLLSIIEQTDKNFEWIVIDDASEISYDKSLKLAKGVNLKYYKNEYNIGAGESRNLGIRNATGEYVVFVDSDDYVDKNFVKRINEIITYSKADAIFFDYQKKCNGQFVRYYTVQGDRFGEIEKEYVLVNVTSNVCGKVFLTRLLRENNVRFPNLKRFEDWVFGITAISYSKTFYYEKRPLYIIVDNSKSVTKNDSNATTYAIIAFNDIKNLEIEKDIIELLFIREVLYTAIKDYGKGNSTNFNQRIEYLICDYPYWYKNKYYRILGWKIILFTTLFRLKAFGIIKLMLIIHSKWVR